MHAKISVFSKVIPKCTAEILAYTTVIFYSVFEAQVCLRLLNEIFGNRLNDESFFTWLAKIFCIRPFKFLSIRFKMKRNEERNKFREVRGRNKTSINTQNKIYNVWLIKICIISTDGRNGQDQVNVSKKQFLQKY